MEGKVQLTQYCLDDEICLVRYYFSHGSCDEVAVSKKLLGKVNLKGYQVQLKNRKQLATYLFSIIFLS